MEECNHNKLNELALEIVELTEKYSGVLPVYEIGNRLIALAVSQLLYCAPNELVGIKTILASVEMGINEYEEDYS